MGLGKTFELLLLLIYYKFNQMHEGPTLCAQSHVSAPCVEVDNFLQAHCPKVNYVSMGD